MIDGTQTVSTTPEEIKVPGVFTIYQQLTNTYCVPACIQSVLIYINESSPSQESIDKEIQMKFSKIPEYMNARQNQCDYVSGGKPSETQLESFIRMDIINSSVPTFLRLSGTTTGDLVSDDERWYYETNGHCVLATSIFEDNSAIWIADPLGGVVSGCPAFYQKKAFFRRKIYD